MRLITACRAISLHEVTSQN